jgi:hypothetical protein
MQRIIKGLLVATSLILPSMVAHPYLALADGPSALTTVRDSAPLMTSSNQQPTITVGGESLAGASSVLHNSEAAVLLLRPDLETRVLDQAGPHDPTIYPPASSQETLVLGQSDVLTLQVRNASDVEADKVEVELYLTGLLDPDQVLRTSNGFVCTPNLPDAHFVLCTGGTLTEGGWDTAASISVRVKAVNMGTSYIAATVNPDHAIAESDGSNDQDAIGVTVTAPSLHPGHPSAQPS